MVENEKNDNINIIKFDRIINENNDKLISRIENILEFASGFICWGTGDCIEIYDKKYEKKNEISVKEGILNNVIIESLNDEIYIITCFTDKIKLNKIENLSKIVFIDSFEDQYITQNGKISFIIRRKEKEYFVFHEKNIYLYVNIFNKISNILMVGIFWIF